VSKKVKALVKAAGDLGEALAALAAEVPSSAVTTPAGDGGIDYALLSKQELKVLCKERALTGYKSLSRPDIVAALREDDIKTAENTDDEDLDSDEEDLDDTDEEENLDDEDEDSDDDDDSDEDDDDDSDEEDEDVDDDFDERMTRDREIVEAELGDKDIIADNALKELGRWTLGAPEDDELRKALEAGEELTDKTLRQAYVTMLMSYVDDDGEGPYVDGEKYTRFNEEWMDGWPTIDGKSAIEAASTKKSPAKKPKKKPKKRRT
jgi:hypothetical protein